MSRDYTVTIATLCKDKFSLTNDLLADLKRFEFSNIDEIIIIDNNSQEQETTDGLKWWRKESGLPIQIKWMDENLGFTLGANYGLKIATYNRMAERRIVFLISNDVSVSGKFIQQTADIISTPKRILVGHKLISWDSGWNTFDGKVFPYLEGYFLAACVDDWVDLDFFDVNYAPWDYEDIDLSTKARSRNYQLVPLNNPAITHLGGGTLGYNPEREKITRRNQEYFKNKWLK